MSDQVPHEMWSEMFFHLPRISLLQASRTSRLFFEISRPQIFTKFEFHPYILEADSGPPVPPKSSTIQRAMERLTFWASPDIAPLIRVCEITPFGPPHRRSTSKSGLNHDPYVLLTAFFQNLARFVGLETIHATKIHFTKSALSNLCLLPNLRTFCVEGYKEGPGEKVDLSSS
ncbi:hypothetical protein C8J57DRAFT_1472090 [Mycena rebaudengoi]|nr:hypothetical protein C8J57DRAFT_1472090 [Mycena rebaudengoi]